MISFTTASPPEIQQKIVGGGHPGAATSKPSLAIKATAKSHLLITGTGFSPGVVKIQLAAKKARIVAKVKVLANGRPKAKTRWPQKPIKIKAVDPTTHQVAVAKWKPTKKRAGRPRRTQKARPQ